MFSGQLLVTYGSEQTPHRRESKICFRVAEVGTIAARAQSVTVRLEVGPASDCVFDDLRLFAELQVESAVHRVIDEVCCMISESGTLHCHWNDGSWLDSVLLKIS